MSTENNTESTRAPELRACLKECARVWEGRCAELGLKRGTKGRMVQLEAYLQGTLAALTASGLMPHTHAQQIALLVAVGRGEDTVTRWLQADA